MARKRLTGERLMQLLLIDAKIPFVQEHRFHPVRRWRFDFAIPEAKVAIEVEGGVFSQGRHTRGIGYSADLVKYNCATEMGWRVLRYTTQQIDTNAINQIRRVVQNALYCHGDR